MTEEVKPNQKTVAEAFLSYTGIEPMQGEEVDRYKKEIAREPEEFLLNLYEKGLIIQKTRTRIAGIWENSIVLDRDQLTTF